MKKRSSRSRVSNSAITITGLLLRVVFRRLSTITGCFESEVVCACTKGIVRVFDYGVIRYGHMMRNREKLSDTTSFLSEIIVGNAKGNWIETHPNVIVTGIS